MQIRQIWEADSIIVLDFVPPGEVLVLTPDSRLRPAIPRSLHDLCL